MRISRRRVWHRLIPSLISYSYTTDYKYEPNDEPPPKDDDEVRKREEEELQRVLELSMQDKGGRKNWGEYSLASSSGAGGSGSQINTAHQFAAAPAPASSSSTAQGRQPPSFSSGYVPSTEAHTQAVPEPEESPPSLPPASLPTSAAPSAEVYGVTRVRALHTFEPTEPNELAFEKGDIIKVVNREYKDWWRGQLRGRTGIFPVNYVVRLHLPSCFLLFTHRCAGGSSGTYGDRIGGRSAAGSRRFFTGSQRRSVVDHVAYSGPRER